LKNKNVVTGIHTGYYYQESEILSVLRGCKEDATMELVMHRFEGSSGTFNDGELRWERRAGEIVQTNAATGESYSHPCNEKWFQHQTWCDVPVEKSLAKIESGDSMVDNPDYDSLRALTWSVNKMTDNVYKVSIVACPAHAYHLDPRSSPVLSSSMLEIQKAGCVVLDVGDKVSIPIKAEHAPLFDHLRTSMVSCTRSEAKYKSHVNTVKAKARAWFVENKIPEEVDSQSVSNLIEASFWADFRRDCKVAASIHVDAQWFVRQYDLALAGKSLSRAPNSVALFLDILAHALRAKTGKETAAAVLESFRLVNARIT